MRWLRSAAWLGSLTVAGIGIGCASAALQRAGVAPLTLSSLVVGAFLGIVAIGAGRYFRVYDRRILVAGTVAAALTLVASQHLYFYRQHLRGWERAHEREPQLSLFRDPTPQPLGAYLQQEAAGGHGWLWLLDAAIVTATSAGIAAGMRRDYSEVKME